MRLEAARDSSNREAADVKAQADEGRAEFFRAPAGREAAARSRPDHGCTLGAAARRLAGYVLAVAEDAGLPGRAPPLQSRLLQRE
jgi:hypothetical protein